MEKPSAIIELGSKKMKLIIGYELDGKPYVLYALTKPYSHVIEGGVITNLNKLIETVKEFKTFSDDSVKLKVSISEAILSLPPFGLEVFDTSPVTTVISEEGKITNLDIRNIYSIIRNGTLPSNTELVDVAPEQYVLDADRTFAKPPLNETSTTLTVNAKGFCLPSRVVETYQNALIKSGINLKRASIAPMGAAELYAAYDDSVREYILVDIGSCITTVSLVGEGKIFSSAFFEWGGDSITERIIESFNVNEAEAEKVKIMYGLDKREMNFKVAVCSSDDGEGNEIKHYSEELNEIIKKELDVFVTQLHSAIDEVLKYCDASCKTLPMILVGGGSQLNGLVSYLEPKVDSESVKVFTPKTLGARNPTFTNCLGLLIANAKYPNVYDESHPRIAPVTRDPVK